MSIKNCDFWTKVMSIIAGQKIVAVWDCTYIYFFFGINLASFMFKIEYFHRIRELEMDSSFERSKFILHIYKIVGKYIQNKKF